MGELSDTSAGDTDPDTLAAADREILDLESMNGTQLVMVAALGSLSFSAACSKSAPLAEAPEGAAAENAEEGAETCGPQSPRDIAGSEGNNTIAVPTGETPTLCNVHFHDPFEHSGFAPAPKVSGEPGEPVCKSVEVGDKLEFHWVYTNCPENEEVIKGLANCVCDREDLVLRVFAQSYVVSTEGVTPEQPGEPLVAYAGSTTGPSYDNDKCSPAKVNWHVNRETLALSKAALGDWCGGNPWPGEDHPHQSRELVTSAEALSPISD